jgi:hypothetical protein
MEDEFVDIIGYEGLYQINRNGKIFSLTSNKILKERYNNGYIRYSLYKDGECKSHLLHRLLAIQFIPNSNNLPEIDHMDRNKLNNDLGNLRWCDCQMNIRNRNCVINHKGTISIKRITEMGEYYQAQFYIDYGKRKRKCSYDKNELEEWLIEMRNEYARNEIYV